MSNIAIKAEKRNNDELKRSASGRLRAAGFIPGTIYGQSKEPLNIKFSRSEFKEIIKGKSMNNIILEMHVKADGKEKKETALIKEVQQNPMNLEYLHIDFMRIEMKTEVEATVHVSIINEESSVGVKMENGVVQHGVRELHIICLPSDIPDKIEYDIRNLSIGHIIRVSDLVLKEGIKVLNSPEEVIVAIVHPHAEAEQTLAAASEGADAAEPVVLTGKKAAEKE
jgi:large subunit ribosomal protein L25